MNRLIAAYDRLIYTLAVPAMRRMCLRNSGVAIVLKLHIEDFLLAHPVSQEQKDLAEVYFEQRKPSTTRPSPNTSFGSSEHDKKS